MAASLASKRLPSDLVLKHWVSNLRETEEKDSCRVNLRISLPTDGGREGGGGGPE